MSVQLESEILEAITLGHIDHESSQQFAASVLQQADQVVNFVEAHPVELSAAAVLVGVAIWAAAPAGTTFVGFSSLGSGGTAFGALGLGTTGQFAATGASTNVAGGIISGRYDNMSALDASGRIMQDVVVGGGFGIAFGAVPGLGTFGPQGRAATYGVLNAAQGLASTVIDALVWGDDADIADVATNAGLDFVLGAGISLAFDHAVLRAGRIGAHRSPRLDQPRPTGGAVSIGRYDRQQRWYDARVAAIAADLLAKLESQAVAVLVGTNITGPILKEVIELLNELSEENGAPAIEGSIRPAEVMCQLQ